MGNCFSRRSGAKKKYWTEKDAQSACDQTMTKYNEPMRYYLCPHCGAWHIGGVKNLKHPVGDLNDNK